MAIENRNLEAGMKLAARYKGQTYSATVVQLDEGIRYQLATGETFTSLSKAGSHVMKGVACNGWRFWSLADDLPEPRERQHESFRTTPKAKRRAQPQRLIRRLPMQKGRTEKSLRWWCSACMASFTHTDDREPEWCPEGHPREASDEVEMA